MADEQGGVWIRTVPDMEGIYRPVVELDDDTSHPIDDVTAVAYARAILVAVAYAEYDAAVIRQMTTVCNQEAAVDLVRRMRGDRPLLVWPAPLELEPGVSARTGEAFLAVSLHGLRVGQWDMAQAREHALGVLEAVEVAPLDSAYLRALRAIDVEEGRARVVVDDLARYRMLEQEGGVESWLTWSSS